MRQPPQCGAQQLPPCRAQQPASCRVQQPPSRQAQRRQRCTFVLGSKNFPFSEDLQLPFCPAAVATSDTFLQTLTGVLPSTPSLPGCSKRRSPGTAAFHKCKLKRDMWVYACAAAICQCQITIRDSQIAICAPCTGAADGLRAGGGGGKSTAGCHCLPRHLCCQN